MSMNKFCWIANRFRRYGLHSFFKNRLWRFSRKFNSKSQFFEKSTPEGEIFIYVENSRYTNYTSSSFIFRQRLILKDPIIFIVKHIRYLYRINFKTQTSFAPVPSYILPVVGKLTYSQKTAISTTFTSFCVWFEGKISELWLSYKFCFVSFIIIFLSNKGWAKSSHKTSYVRSYNVLSRNPLKTS